MMLGIFRCWYGRGTILSYLTVFLAIGSRLWGSFPVLFVQIHASEPWNKTLASLWAGQHLVKNSCSCWKPVVLQTSLTWAYYLVVPSHCFSMCELPGSSECKDFSACLLWCFAKPPEQFSSLASQGFCGRFRSRFLALYPRIPQGSGQDSSWAFKWFSEVPGSLPQVAPSLIYPTSRTRSFVA